ncbi:hypothetical protein AAG607_13535 [Citromicrobium bathyomarinum]|jgi:hypothetical protein|uniref:hypothetical protein n=1 Tax=Sphingomonadales TaxID=204457 RepID=UPI000C56193E|nr:hypothetical protein [Citromicrobium sp.]MBO81860.1 hypothetical protein [Citromicrobium sp.]|tara:strand:- start:7367 stop:7918 length:552 start_codon:yes stop_codon:yes gene_type:complete
MQSFTKAALCTAAAGAMAFTSAAPAEAQRYRDRDNDGISAGEVIAGALIIGGIAAIASASNKDRDRYRDHRYRDNYYRSNGNPRRAINKCVRVAENQARRAGYRFANVVDINRVRDTRRGWNITGRIEVDGARGYRDQRRGYNDRYDRRGYNRRGDTGRFSCQIRRGRVVDVDYRGIRGLNRI